MCTPPRVEVVALDPMRGAAVTAALLGRLDVAVAAAGRGAEASAAPAATAAAVVVVAAGGITDEVVNVLRDLQTAGHRPATVLVADDPTPAEALAVVRAGARGLVRADGVEDGDLLARAVLAVLRGHSTLPSGMLPHLLEPGVVADPEAPVLSDREHAVLSLIADGRGNREIARELCYSSRTVDYVVRDVTSRFRLRNRTHAIAFAMRAGVL